MTLIRKNLLYDKPQVRKNDFLKTYVNKDRTSNPSRFQNSEALAELEVKHSKVQLDEKLVPAQKSVPRKPAS